MSVDVDELRDHMILVDHKKKRPGLDIIELIAEPPAVALSIDGASTITLVCADAARNLVTSGLLDTRSWISVDGNHFEFAAMSKVADRLTLTYEDAIVAALRRRTKHLVAPAGSTTRAAFAKRLAKEAHVGIDLDPGHREKVRSVLERSAGGTKTNSWDLLADVVAPINWRRFSDLTQLVVGSDDWLHSRFTPIEIRENTGPVGNIDFDLDVGKRASKATVTVDAGQWAAMPGMPVVIADLGPADNRWLISDFSRPLTSSQATVTLTRPKHELKEPRKANKSGNKGKGGGKGSKPSPGGGHHREADPGLDDYLPGLDGTTDGSARTAGRRETMVTWALRQVGRPYEDGSAGPDGYDTSGLVECATRAAGHPLLAPAAAQWAQVVAAGRTIGVDEALRTRGALLFRIGDEAAVAISLGNGSTVEAIGPAYGVTLGRGGGTGQLNTPLFNGEGPRYYKAAYKHNKPFALDGPSHWDWPYQTTLPTDLVDAFESWAADNNIPFDVEAQIVDYDMRGFWLKKRPTTWTEGDHFPDTWKTPYDTRFSAESKYATKNCPFKWHGEKLIDERNGQVIAGPEGREIESRVAERDWTGAGLWL